MYMLAKRTNILFDEELWFKLLTLSEIRKSSVGKLVRAAVKESYFSGSDRSLLAKTIEETRRVRKTVKGINYKELINEGRKY